MDKIKVTLLAAILAILVWMALHPSKPVGRFIAPGGDATLPLVDTVTGKACFGVPAPNAVFPECSTLK